jgi:hypothetical protein
MYLSTELHDVTSQKTVIFTVIDVTTSLVASLSKHKVAKQGAEENIWLQQGRRDKKLDKTA